MGCILSVSKKVVPGQVISHCLLLSSQTTLSALRNGLKQNAAVKENEDARCSEQHKRTGNRFSLLHRKAKQKNLDPVCWVTVLHFKDNRHTSCDNSPRGTYLSSGNASLRTGFPTFGAGVQSLLLCIGPLHLYLVFKLILLCVIHFKFYWNTSSSNFLRKHTWEIYF